MVIKQKILSLAGLFKFQSFERILFRKSALIDPSFKADIRRVTYDNIEDICEYEGRKYIKKYKRFLARGDIGYYGYLNGRCVHRTWFIVGPGVLRKFSYFPPFKLKKREVYVHFGETAPVARGNSIPAAVFNRAAADLEGGVDYFYSLIDEDNYASRKASGKAGFVEVKRFKWTSFLWLNFYREIK